MGMQPEGWIMNIIRTLFAHIDYLVYSLIKFILYGVFDLSTLTTSSDLMNDIYQRIYVLLGIFMAFKLSFSFFQYIVDPESMSGKSEKGASKLIMRVAVMIMALVVLPTLLFKGDNGGIVHRAQTAFLPMLPRILLGINEGTGVASGNDSDIETAANTMAVATLQAFFSVPEELDEYCGAGTAAETPPIESLEDFVKNVNLSCKSDAGLLGIGAPKYYKYSYSFIISTVVGILMAIMLLGVTIDVAKRVFKMVILESIAPIPIMSLIDPKSTKDGAFASWGKSLISTFADIFIKLGLLYLILTLIQLIVSHGLFTNFPEFSEHPIRASYLTVILILGLIFFAKEAPKFIKDSLGIKDSKGGTGSAMGKLAGALTGGLTGAAAGAISGRGIGGALTGMATGASAGLQSAGTGKPSNAWAAARDAAGAARTGDKNYKGGFANSVSQWATSRQQTRAAEEMGVTSDLLKEAKSQMINDANNADTAEREYNELVQTLSTPVEPEKPMIPVDAAEDLVKQITDEYNDRMREYNDQMENYQEKIRTARDKAMEAKTKATSSQKNYEDMSAVAKQYGVKKDKAIEMRQKRSANSYTARARRTVGNAAGSVAGSVRDTAMATGMRIVHGGDAATGRELLENRQALHEARDQKRELEQIQRGERFDPYGRTPDQLNADIQNRQQAIDQRRQGMANRADPTHARDMRNEAKNTDRNFNPKDRN